MKAQPEVHAHTQHQAIQAVFDGTAYYLLQPRSRFWFGRLYLSLDVLTTVFITLFSTFSLNRIAFTALSGNFGFVGVGILAVLAVLALLDVIVNDLLPDRFHLHWARHNRWCIFMGMALVFTTFMYVNATNPMLTALLVRYFLSASGALALAGLDLMERGEEKTFRNRRLTDDPA